MMQMLMEAVPRHGRSHRALLHPNQRILVGRSSRAGLSITQDSQLHDSHFVITGAGTEFRLQANPHATPIRRQNGQVVTEDQLRHGDVFQAGTTLFRIQLRGQSEAPVARARWDIQERTTSSGILATSCGSVSAATLLSTALPAPLHLIVSRQDHKEASQHESARELIADANFGTVFLPAHRAITPKIFQKEWASGTVIGLLSNSSSADVFQSIQNLLGTLSDVQLLVKQLEEGPEIYSQFLMNGLSGILLADADGKWMIYSQQSIEKVLAAKFDASEL